MRSSALLIAASLLVFVDSAHANEPFTSIDFFANSGKTVAIGTDGFDIQGDGRFVYRQLSGDFDLRACITSHNKWDKTSRSSIGLRQAPSVTGRVALISSGNDGNLAFVTRMDTEAPHVIDLGPPGAHNWLRLSRAGDKITVYTANDADGTQWREVGTKTLKFKDPVFVGYSVFKAAVSFRKCELSEEAPATPAVSADARPASRPEASRPVRAPDVEPAAVDPALAAALAISAAKLANEGKFEQAQEMCLKALTYNDAAPAALYELGKLLERGGQRIHAANFLSRAVQELTRQESSNPAYASMRMDAERRLLKLNPHAAQLAEVFASYTNELALIAKKLPDTVTQDEIADRVRGLKLARYVPEDKLPKLQRAVAAGRGAAVPPDVERELKAAGWQKISGAWKKKSANVYEVTDGKLEANYLNGALQVTVHKGSGSVKAMVRNCHRDYSGTYYSYGSGYGVKIENSNCELFTPYSATFSNNNFSPWKERDIRLPEFSQKTLVVITIVNNATEIHVNGKKEKACNYAIRQEGPFIIEVDGTVTIESPASKGQ